MLLSLLNSWISHNPLVCTKELEWLQTWMKLHPIIIRDLDRVTCQTPFGNWSKVFDFDFSQLGKLWFMFLNLVLQKKLLTMKKK